MATIASSIVSPRKMTTSVQRAAKALSSDVVRIRYDIATDWIGTPSIFFRIILTDKASEPENLREVAQRVSLKLMNEAKTDESGLHAYFSFRSRSEQAKLKEPAWA